MKTQLSLMMLALITFMSCAPQPQPIHLNSDNCAHCRMMISDGEFASQLLNTQGRAFKFDSVECLAAFDLTNENPESVHSRWVPNFKNPSEWLEAESAVYLHSETLRSPMGLYISAYASSDEASEMMQEYGGSVVGYDYVLDLVAKEWLNQGGHTMHSQH